MDRTYRIGSNVSREVIEEEIAKAWKDVQHDDQVRTQLAAANVDVSAAASLDTAQSITVRNAGTGFAGETIVIALAAKVASDLWEKVILPRLRKRFGADAVVEQKPNS
jgi:hypothetical protein